MWDGHDFTVPVASTCQSRGLCSHSSLSNIKQSIGLVASNFSIKPNFMILTFSSPYDIRTFWIIDDGCQTCSLLSGYNAVIVSIIISVRTDIAHKISAPPHLRVANTVKVNYRKLWYSSI